MNARKTLINVIQTHVTMSLDCNDDIKSFTCNCVTGINGASCGNNMDNCSPGIIQHGGACNDGVNTYTCNCAAGYNGANCENNINKKLPCVHGKVVFLGVEQSKKKSKKQMTFSI